MSRALLAIIAALSIGCVHASKLEGGRYVGDLSLTPPEGWEEVQNRALMGNQSIVLESPDSCCVVQAELVREDENSLQLPLDIIAELYTVGRGRKAGFQSELISTDELLIDGRRAQAVTVVRHHEATTRFATSIFIRADGEIAILTLSWNRFAPPELMPQWERLIDSFALPNASRPEDPPFTIDPISEELQMEIEVR